MSRPTRCGSPGSHSVRRCPSGFRSPKLRLANTSLITATGRRAGPVAFVEVAAGQDRNLHRREERRSDHQEAVGRIGGTPGTLIGSPCPACDERVLRETRAAHARDRAEPRAEVAVEGGDLRVLVSGLPRVQLEQQQVLAIESELDGLQIRERPHEEPGRDQHQQRDRDLRHHQHVAQADPPERMSRRPAGPALISFRAGMRSTRVALQRRRKAEQDARENRKCGGHARARASSNPRAG